MNKLIKTLLPCLLVILIALAALTPSLASHSEAGLLSASASEASASKEEVVYANLHNDGTVGQIYVVNIFESSTGGTVKDKGDYESVVNLTDTSEIKLTGNELTFSMGSGRFYYQGNMKSTLLPWHFDISYSLDGDALSAEEIAGKSGALEINITTKDSAYADNAFFENYMLQVSLTLDTSKCRNISADGATVANAGKDKIINYTVMPNSAGKLKLSADVTDFEMKPIQITAVPLSISVDTPDTGSLSDELSPFSDAIRQLRDGASLLAEGIGELRNGFAGYKNGFTELRGGSAGFLGGIKSLAEQSPALNEGSAAILEGLKTLSASLETGQLSSLAQLSELPGALYQLSIAAEQVASGLTELETSFSQGYAALSAAIEALPSQALDTSVLAALSASTDPNVLALLSTYQGQLEAIMRLKATFESLKPLFDGVSPALSLSASGLSEISHNLLSISTAMNPSLSASDLNESAGGLKSGIDLFLANYESFHQGLTEYTAGVKELENAYLELDAGIGSLYGGTAEFTKGLDGLYGGASELSEGTNELFSKTGDMDGLISEKIEELLSGFDKSDFVPTSFVSQGQKVSSVQFVFKTAGISIPEPEPAAPAVAERPTFLKKLLSLFGL
ncbi:MAG TPA: hypothetical protein GXZ65_06270 [Clostridiales bacterium]|jgi:putative membrane protein|nr:hypothetical protein [Clostridiales bacterium]